MKKFNFSLQTLLNLRVAEEKKNLLELGQLNLERSKMVREIEKYNEELSRAFELPFEDTDLTDGRTLSLIPPVFKGVRIKIENIKNSITKLDREIENKKDILIKKKSEVKSFEKIKANELNKFKLKYQKYEQSEAEDSFSMNKHRKKNELF